MSTWLGPYDDPNESREAYTATADPAYVESVGAELSPKYRRVYDALSKRIQRAD